MKKNTVKILLICPNCGNSTWITRTDERAEGAFECAACEDLVFPEDMCEEVEEIKTEDKFTLVGVDGNAYSIMGYTANALKKSGLRDKVDEMYARAKSGDYDNLLRVCMEYIDMANKAIEER